MRDMKISLKFYIKAWVENKEGTQVRKNNVAIPTVQTVT